MGGIFKRTGNGKRDFGKANLIIFLFALAHALLCYLLHDTSVGDGLFLTILTIAMVFCLIRFYGSPLDVFLGLAFLSCFAGFYFGTSVGDYLHKTFPALGAVSYTHLDVYKRQTFYLPKNSGLEVLSPNRVK